jgi:hypothetical protein
MKNTSKSGLNVRAGIRAGGVAVNHSRGGLKVRASVRAGGVAVNHMRAGLRVKSSVKAGYTPMANNHNQRLLSIR